MPYVEVDGVLKKVACGPCIRGHRSSKCEHHDRVMIEVRKPGRPLSSCPHPPGSCTCSRVVINYTIPKNAACPSTVGAASASAVPQTPTSGAGTSRVSKPRQKRASTVVNVSGIEKALKVEENDVNAAASNDSSTVNQNSSDVSPISSHTSSGEQENSGPRRRLSFSGPEWTNTFDSRLASQRGSSGIEAAKPEGGSCCSGKSKPAPPPKPVVKSCCSGGSSDTKSDGLPHAEQQRQGTFKVSLQPMAHAVYPPITPEHFLYNQALQVSNGMSMPTPTFFGYSPSGQPQSDLAFQQSLQAAALSIHIPTEKNGAPQAMDHDCNCGDGCACLGCAAHPHNKTTTDYILRMNEYMMGPPPLSDQPDYVNQNSSVPHGYSHAPNAQNFSFNGQMGLVGGGNAYSRQQMSINPATAQNGHAAFGFTAQHNDPAHWQINLAQSSSHATPTQEMEKLYVYGEASQSPLSNAKGNAVQDRQGFDQMRSANGYEESDYDRSAGQSPEGNSPVLSPSSFYLQTLVIPGCTDTSGTCQCGDGCACVGCLTHGGHNGIPLDTVPETDQNDQLATSFPPATSGFQEAASYAESRSVNGQGGQSFPPPQPVPSYGNSNGYMAPGNGPNSSSVYQFPVSAFAGGPG